MPLFLAIYRAFWHDHRLMMNHSDRDIGRFNGRNQEVPEFIQGLIGF